MNTTQAAAASSQARNIRTARTILAQLGGGRALFMLGSKHKPSAIEDGIRISIRSTKHSGKAANILEIVLTPEDLYRVRLVKHTSARMCRKTWDMKPAREAVVRELDGVFAEDLARTVENMTGYRLSL